MPIENYLDGGPWDRSCDDAERETVQRSLAADPRRAWRVGLLEPARQSKLIELGLSARELRGWLRAGMRRTVLEMGARGDGAQARAMLLVEGVLRQDMPQLRLELSADQLVEWGRRLSGLGQGPEVVPSPCAVLRLLVDGRTRPAHLGESPQEHAELVAAFRAAVRAAVRELCRARGLSSKLWACLVGIHLASFRNSDDDEPASEDVLTPAGLPANAVQQMLDALRGGDQEAAAHLVSLTAVDPDFGALLRQETFRECCIRFGILPDADIMKFEYEGSDPWVQFVVGEVKSTNPRMDRVRATWKLLGPAERVSRSTCLKLLDKADLLAFPSIERQVLDEVRRVRPSGAKASSSDRQDLCECIFAAAVGVRLTNDDSKTRETLLRVGGEQMVAWEEVAWRGYRVAPDKALSEEAAKPMLEALRPDAMQADIRFRRLSDRVRALQARDVKDRDFEALDAVGRGWLCRYVVDGLAPDVPASGFDAGLGILEDPDRRQVAQWISASRSNPQDLSWARERMSPIVEMRLREAAASVLRPRGAWRPKDDSALEELARANMDTMLANMGGQDQQHALQALNACLAAIQSGANGPSPSLLTAFRRGDATEFRRRLLGASVDLPARVPRPSQWGIASSIGSVAALLLVGWILLEPLGFLGSGAPADKPREREQRLPLERGWREIPGQPFHFRVLGAGDVQALFPAPEIARELFEVRASRDVVDWPVAQELLLRFRARTESTWPAGVPGVGSWVDRTIDLPGLPERAMVAKVLSVPEKDIFVKPEVEAVGSHDKRVCVVIIRPKR